MFVFRNVTACTALASMVVFSMVGCCCSGSCGLPFCKKNVAPEVSSEPCSTCAGQTSYSAPAQSFTSPSLGYDVEPQSYSTQEFSTEQFALPVETTVPTQTAAVEATVAPKAVPAVVEQGSGGGGFIPKIQSSLKR